MSNGPLSRQASAALVAFFVALGVAAAPAPPAAPSAASSVTGDPAPGAAGAMAARIAMLESRGRAQPRAAEQALGALKPQTSHGSAEWLELVLVQGLLLADLVDRGGAERASAELEDGDLGRQAPGPEAASETASGAVPRAPPRAPSLAVAAALLVRAHLTHLAGNLPQADRLAGEAAARLPGDASPVMRLRFLLIQADIKDASGQLEDAVRLGHEALALADGLGVPWRRAKSRTALAYSYFQARQVEVARRFNDEAIAIATQDGDDLALARALNNRSILLDGLGDLEGERDAMEGAIEHAHRAGAKADEAVFTANLADFYLKQADYPTALQLSERALPLVRELKDLTGETVALANMGLALISMHQVEEGRRRLAESIAIDERRGAQTSIAATLGDMGIYLERAGDLTGAADAYHRARRLGDEILQRDQQRAIVEMQEQYDNELRNRELDLLNRDNRLKTEQLRRRTLEQRAWVLLAAAGLLSLGLAAALVQRQRASNLRLRHGNERLRVVSERDPLTGLANRRHLQAEMRRLAADGRLAGTVYLVDIDEFKHINDTHGHAAGDGVLIEIAQRLRLALRAPDLLVRWGGEEFVVIVQGLGPAQVEVLAQRMLDEVGSRPVLAGSARPIRATASIGFASFPLEPHGIAVSWERAIDLVDTAMYLAKSHGRNRAYGVRLLLARQESELAAITRALEDAWRAGQVALTLLRGPRRPGDER